MHILVARRLTMRPPVLADAEDIALHLTNPNVARMLGSVPQPYWAEDAEEWIAGLAREPGGLVYTIHRERLIGVVSIEGAGLEPRLAYWLGEPWHGQGFMSEAARTLLAHAFATGRFEAVVSSVFVDDPASLRVQEKLGFTVTGAGETWCRSRAATVRTWKTRLAAAAFGALPHSLDRTAA